MSTQKKVWMGVTVLAALALLAVPFTAYANRQREASQAAAQRQAEAARWETVGDYYQRHAAEADALQREAGGDTSAPLPVYDATGAQERALEAAKAGALSTPAPAVDWDAERARMTAMPGYTPAGSRPTAAPAPGENGR